MKVAFFINGPEDHGIVRASIILANGLARLENTSVAVVRDPDPLPHFSDFTAFAPLRAADLVVVHASSMTPVLWGPRESRAGSIIQFCSRVQRPVIVYLHDVYDHTELRDVIDSAKDCLKSVRNPKLLPTNLQRLLFRIMRPQPTLEARFLVTLDSHASGFVVSNPEEQNRLRGLRLKAPVAMVPHFIERRRGLREKDSAKEILGLSGQLVVTLLGFISWLKGHDIALSMLRWLPKETALIFAGRTYDPTDPFFLALLRRIEELGVSDRVHITGYLDDDDLDVYLSATDVAICPFRDVAASSSFATWLAAAKPIVATDLPLFRRYRSEFGNRIMLAPREDARSFAQWVADANARSASIEQTIRHGVERYSVENVAAILRGCLEDMIHTPQIRGTPRARSTG